MRNFAKQLNKEKIASFLFLIPQAFYPLYLVGGTVRDMLLEKDIKDIDIVVHNIDSLVRELKKDPSISLFPLGHNKVKKCYRAVKKTDKTFFIDINECEGKSIKEDLSKRDFTFNAIALEVEDVGKLGKIIDPFGGEKALENKEIIAVDEEAFVADPLRLLRAYRFAATYGFSIEQRTAEYIGIHKNKIKTVSVERITEELFKILEYSSSCKVIREMGKSGLLENIFPEIIPMKGCEQKGYHHLDVWEHSLLTLENCENIIHQLTVFFPETHQEISNLLSHPDAYSILKLSCIFHDIGKPSTKSVNQETNKISFRNHDVKGSEMVIELGNRLKLSNKNSNRLYTIVREHRHIHALLEEGVKKKTIVNWQNRIKDDVVFIAVMGLADRLSVLGELSSVSDRETYQVKTVALMKDYFGTYQELFKTPPFVTGHDLIQMGLKPGKKFSVILKKIREGQINKEFKSRKEAIDFVQKMSKTKKKAV
ncbi:MAG: CCA tRNA nucleotidyltransferase [Nitrospinae bacterium]|nr:CCA tRNA nucleotidyltransferase [Nitrospinota bacterium]